MWRENKKETWETRDFNKISFVNFGLSKMELYMSNC